MPLKVRMTGPPRPYVHDMQLAEFFRPFAPVNQQARINVAHDQSVSLARTRLPGCESDERGPNRHNGMTKSGNQ